MSTAVKICGITRVEDALVAARCGAHAIGLVFYRPSPRYVEPRAAAEIVRALPPFVTPVGLFVDAAEDEVRSVAADTGVQLLQFHGSEPPEFCARFGLPFLKVVRVRPGVDLLQYARDFHGAKGLLLDAFQEGLHGGTGATFDWALIPPALPLPVVLSGGLSPQNVGVAIRRVKPAAVDVSSGVEASKGIKDAAKIAAFISGVRNADV
ncbi:MAG TPA: phosphoribosylanthranilate isomerase [Burkholderiales bacterium]|jgi:phosphoribosylanthranilate isomerase|nr:phosphoribosylanthranilate isomerase [Burkholderiales bacterium]